jgi:hypothetical protein
MVQSGAQRVARPDWFRDDERSRVRGGGQHDHEGVAWIPHGTSSDTCSRMASAGIIAHDAEEWLKGDTILVLSLMGQAGRLSLCGGVRISVCVASEDGLFISLRQLLKHFLQALRLRDHTFGD